VANIKPDPAYLPGKLKTEIERRLRETFSFEKRQFGQPVTYSEVISCIQNTSGVIAVDLDYLFRSDASPVLSFLLGASIPAPSREAISAAELLTLDPRPIELNIIP